MAVDVSEHPTVMCSNCQRLFPKSEIVKFRTGKATRVMCAGCHAHRENYLAERRKAEKTVGAER